jgi:hypothetical protein
MTSLEGMSSLFFDLTFIASIYIFVSVYHEQTVDPNKNQRMNHSAVQFRIVVVAQCEGRNAKAEQPAKVKV